MIWWYRIQTVLILTSGTALLMWLGEQITERGIGNGISLIITIGILASIPEAFLGLQDMFFPPAGLEDTGKSPIVGALLAVMFIAVVVGVIMITQGQRKIPVQYASRAVGRKMYQGGNNFMPLRVNYAGVMPIIFAQALLMFPQPLLAASSIKAIRDMAPYFNYTHPFYTVMFSLMIVFFSYFWVATQFNEVQIADDLKRNNGYIPGVRPGKATSEFLHKVMSRITLAGAAFLVAIAVLPTILSATMEIPYIVTSFFGGTSLLIMVGVMLDTMRQMETHLLNRHYDGFLKKGRIKGRF
jgi:preprotein translocase subunit SecY